MEALWKKVLKNMAGLVLVLAGIILWITPIVPGLFLVPIGLAIMDFPGKKRLGHKLRQIEFVDRLWRRIKREDKPKSASVDATADPIAKEGEDERQDTAQARRPDGDGR